MNRFSSVALIVTLLVTTPSIAQQRGPAFDFESMMDTWFAESNGTLRFGDYTVAFAPEGQFNGEVAVLDKDNNILARHSFLTDYTLREGVFGKVRVNGPGEVQLTTPGMYSIVFLIDGKPVSRLPVVLKQTGAGDDPFNPQKTFAFDGYWRTFAHLTMTAPYEPATPELNLWVGGPDLPQGKEVDLLFADLIRDGQPVAHSKRDQGHIHPEHFKRQKLTLFHPHDGKEINAKPFTREDWLVDGKYEVRVTRASDGQMIRSFDFLVADGAFEPHPQTQADYEPAFDYIAPRVQKKNTSMFEMIEAVWIQDRPL